MRSMVVQASPSTAKQKACPVAGAMIGIMVLMATLSGAIKAKSISAFFKPLRTANLNTTNPNNTRRGFTACGVFLQKMSKKTPRNAQNRQIFQHSEHFD